MVTSSTIRLLVHSHVQDSNTLLPLAFPKFGVVFLSSKLFALLESVASIPTLFPGDPIMSHTNSTPREKSTDVVSTSQSSTSSPIVGDSDPVLSSLNSAPIRQAPTISTEMSEEVAPSWIIRTMQSIRSLQSALVWALETITPSPDNPSFPSTGTRQSERVSSAITRRLPLLKPFTFKVPPRDLKKSSRRTTSQPLPISHLPSIFTLSLVVLSLHDMICSWMNPVVVNISVSLGVPLDCLSITHNYLRFLLLPKLLHFYEQRVSPLLQRFAETFHTHVYTPAIPIIQRLVVLSTGSEADAIAPSSRIPKQERRTLISNKSLKEGSHDEHVAMNLDSITYQLNDEAVPCAVDADDMVGNCDNNHFEKTIGINSGCCSSDPTSSFYGNKQVEVREPEVKAAIPYTTYGADGTNDPGIRAQGDPYTLESGMHGAPQTTMHHTTMTLIETRTFSSFTLPISGFTIYGASLRYSGGYIYEADTASKLPTTGVYRTLSDTTLNDDDFSSDDPIGPANNLPSSISHNSTSSMSSPPALTSGKSQDGMPIDHPWLTFMYNHENKLIRYTFMTSIFLLYSIANIIVGSLTLASLILLRLVETTYIVSYWLWPFGTRSYLDNPDSMAIGYVFGNSAIPVYAYTY